MLHLVCLVRELTSSPRKKQESLVELVKKELDESKQLRLEEENKAIAELDKLLIQIEPLNEVEQIIITPQIAGPEPAVESVEEPICDQVDTIIDSLSLNEEVEDNSLTQVIEPESETNQEQDIYTSSQHHEDNEDN